MKTATLTLTLAALLAAPLAGSAAERAPAPGPEAPDPPAVAPVQVVATLPVYAALAEAIGGAEVEAEWIADPNEDSHFVRPKPSFALKLKRADLFITTGLDLELWVPALLDKAKNPDVMEGSPGYVTAYTGIELLDIPAAADRGSGDVHVYGNPHLHTDPLRALQVARNITTGLVRVAPDRADHFRRGLAELEARIHEATFGAELVEMLGGEALERMALGGTLFSFLEDNEYEGVPLRARLGGWLQAAASLRGSSIICYHKNWAYFEDRFGVTCAAYVEAKPGIPPTPRHAARLIQLMRDQGIGTLLAASYFDRGKVETVAQRGGATPVIVPMYNGAQPGLDTYFDLVDHWIVQLLQAAR